MKVTPARVPRTPVSVERAEQALPRHDRRVEDEIVLAMQTKSVVTRPSTSTMLCMTGTW